MLEALGLTLFHTGVVVDDLDASMTALSTLNGLHWAPPQITETPMVGPAGPLPRKVRFTYSIEGPHHVELLQQLDSAPYESLTGGRRVHHLGYLANDLEADAARLDAAGFRCEMHGVDEQGRTSRATYHYSPLFPGMWIELVAPDTWSSLRQWIDAAREEAGLGA